MTTNPDPARKAPQTTPATLLRLVAAILDPTDPYGTWRLYAACRGHPRPDIWHPPKARAAKGMKRSASEQRRRLIIAEAKSICAGCPVTTQCLAYGNKMADYNAIWGGKTGRERGRKRDQP